MIREVRCGGDASGPCAVLIPTWNNLPYLRLCVAALRRHSAHPHRIVVHVNEGRDGTAEWLRSEGIDHTVSDENVGVCHAVNAARRLAREDLLVYMNDDMVPLPGWDAALLETLEETGEEACLSGTLVEPVDTGNPCVVAPRDFGRGVDDFREAELLAAAPDLRRVDWSGSTWPPVLLPARLWDRVGGFSPEFSPGMYSDPDLSMKLWAEGVRAFRGVGASLTYHFMSKSVGRVRRNDGRRTFLRKWGLSASTFDRHYLRRGTPWTGPLAEPEASGAYLAARLKDRLKLLLTGRGPS